MSTKIINVIFRQSGVPKTGLSPTIRIRDLSDNSLVITDAAMVEVGDGGYKYEFTSFDNTKNYQIRADGGSSLFPGDRYVFTNSEVVTDTELLLDRVGDPVSEPGGLSDSKTLSVLMWHLFSRFYFKNTQTASEQKTYKSDNTTILADRPTSDDGTTQTLGKAS